MTTWQERAAAHARLAREAGMHQDASGNWCWPGESTPWWAAQAASQGAK